jgi:hypothetical protein
MSNTDKIQAIETAEINNEILQCTDALEGIKKADAFIFYTDKAGRGNTLFIDNLKHFPFDLQKEIKIILSDAIEIYKQQLNTQNNEQ